MKLKAKWKTGCYNCPPHKINSTETRDDDGTLDKNASNPVHKAKKPRIGKHTASTPTSDLSANHQTTQNQTRGSNLSDLAVTDICPMERCPCYHQARNSHPLASTGIQTLLV
jgi:hypothetical protein